MLNILISLLIRLFFMRPPGIAPGQRAGELPDVFEELQALAYGRRIRRPAPSIISTPAAPKDDFEFSL